MKYTEDQLTKSKIRHNLRKKRAGIYIQKVPNVEIKDGFWIVESKMNYDVHT